MNKKILGIGIILASCAATTVFASSNNISIKKAKEIALKKVPGGTITNIELDYERNKQIYDIDIVLNQYEYDLKLDATTGHGISVTKELRDDYVATKPSTNGYITREEAKSIALKKVPGGTITKIELDHQAGRPIYEIELILNQYEYDLKLDATTGHGISVYKELRDGYEYSNQQVSGFITQEQAKNAVLAKFPNAVIRKIELDRDDQVYELDIKSGRSKYEVTVSATSGQVISYDLDD